MIYNFETMSTMKTATMTKKLDIENVYTLIKAQQSFEHGINE